MSDPSGSKAYRNPTVEEDDDDFDDLDDVLASFNKPAGKVPPQPVASSSTSPRDDQGDETSVRPSGPALGAGAAGPEEEDFEASLVEGMESLLRQLAGDHPPGLAKGETQQGTGDTGPAPGHLGQTGLSTAEEEAEWQKALEMMLSGEGLSALGMDSKGRPAGAQAASTSPAAASKQPMPQQQPAGGPADQPSFEETIRRTMDSLKAGGEGSRTGAGGAGGAGNPPDLAKLLEQLGSDPSLLDGLGDGDGDELGGLLDGMMSQLMTKEVLEEPMAELASKYPAYLASPPADVSPASLEKYKQQHEIVKSIVALFRKSDFSDERDGKEVARLVGEMQDLGGPPEQVLGEMPEGFDMAKMLGGDSDEACVIM